MPKATKIKDVTSPVLPNIKEDTATIANDFATVYSVEDNFEAVRAALQRRCTNKESFNLIRIASCAAWLMRKGYEKPRAIALMDKTLQAPTGIIKGKEKRTDQEQRDYKTAGAHWSDYLVKYDVESMNGEMKRPRKPRVPRGPPAPPASDKDKVDAAPPAPIAPQAFVATKLPSLNDVTAQIGAIVASLSQVGKANVAIIKGDKGAAIRDLIAHNVAAIKAIEALEG